MKVGHTPLQWSDALSTGNPAIDQQHRMLLSILNEVNECFRDGGDAVARWRVVSDLVSYTVYHFDTEEQLMETSGYADRYPDQALGHIKAHRAFATEVVRYQTALKQGQAVDYESFFSFLNNWLVEHVLGIDKHLGQFAG